MERRSADARLATTAQSQTLAFPQYVHSISTNADNQDVVSMGTDSALITSRVLDNAFVVLAIEVLTLAQATDFLKVEKRLSASSLGIYKNVRQIQPAIVDDKFIGPQLKKLVDSLSAL